MADKRIIVITSTWYDAHMETNITEIDRVFVVESDETESELVEIMTPGKDQTVHVFPYMEAAIGIKKVKFVDFGGE